MPLPVILQRLRLRTGIVLALHVSADDAVWPVIKNPALSGIFNIS